MREIRCAYTGNMLRVDLTAGVVKTEELDHELLRKYLGGAGLGAKILFDEVPPDVKWFDPENRLIIALGPINGTTLGGSGCITVVTIWLNTAITIKMNGA